eukprot:2737800-Amphidinium_carterae.1
MSSSTYRGSKVVWTVKVGREAGLEVLVEALCEPRSSCTQAIERTAAIGKLAWSRFASNASHFTVVFENHVVVGAFLAPYHPDKPPQMTY